MYKNNTFTFIDLFSGIGGFRIALNRIGGYCLNFSEINDDAINTYGTNFNEEKSLNLGDITKIKDLPPHDLLTAGVPCQSWSIAGKNLGFDDDRGQLWNDTLYLLNKSKPKAFIFENVKGLADPRNSDALFYLLKRIKDAGYFANYYVINSFDYGVPQNRVRIYIVGFLEKKYFLKFHIGNPVVNKTKLVDILPKSNGNFLKKESITQLDLFGYTENKRSFSLSSNNEFNDYFLFNDLRNGNSTIHSWDILNTTERQKEICYILLKNRRKKIYGNLDGNPLSIKDFQAIDASITQHDLDDLANIDILKSEEYSFILNEISNEFISKDEEEILQCIAGKYFVIDDLKNNTALKIKKIPVIKSIQSLIEKKIVICVEIRYDFKNTKISTGLYGVNRIFLPSSNIFPTLVASDSNDYITLVDINSDNAEEYKKIFIEEVYKKNNYRKITKEEACLIQGFPSDFLLPESRTRWMRLLGNSVTIPVIEMLGNSILATGVFSDNSEVPAVFS